MTTTTAQRPANVPAANLQRASTPSIDEPGLIDTVAHATGATLIDGLFDFALPLPVTAALDAFDQAEGASKAIDVLREDTTAASLKLNETAETELKAKVEVLDGAAYGQVAAKVAVGKKPDGYEVSTTVTGGGGASLTTNKGADAKKSPGVEGEAGMVLGVTVTHKVKTAAEADAKVDSFKTKALTNMALAQFPSGPKGQDEAASGMLGVYDAQRDGYAGAASVKTSVEANAELEASLWKDEHDSGKVAATLGLKLETQQALVMDVKDENGAKSVTFSTSMKVAAELEGGGEAEPLEELEGSFTGLGVAGEATITRSKTYPLPKDFNPRDASNVAKVLAAVQGEGKDEVSVEVKAQVGRSQHVAGKLVVDGDLGDAVTVAAAALGKGDAKGIAVSGEVTRSFETPSSGSLGLGGVVSLDVDLNRTQELQTVKVNDTSALVKQLGKKAFEGALDTGARLVNAR